MSRHRTVAVVVAFACISGSPLAAAEPACDYFVSATGLGGRAPLLSSIRAFTTPDASGSVPAVDPESGAGRTLCLLDGTYTGASMMIDVRDVHGTPGAPVVFAALSDGGAILDGETIHAPIRIEGSSHVRIEGVDARNAIGSVIQIDGHRSGPDSDTHHLTLRRVVAINANPVFDKDGDGIHSPLDNCTDVWNPAQEDSFGSPSGDACENEIVGGDYGDLLHDLCLANPVYIDAELGIDCPLMRSQPGGLGCGEPDADSDGVPDVVDNCVFVANGPLRATGLCDAQVDGNLDGFGDACDADLNGDGTVGVNDASLLMRAVSDQVAAAGFDLDCDGEVGASDIELARSASRDLTRPGPSGQACADGTCSVPDLDGDGVSDASDNCRDRPNGPLRATGRCDRQQDPGLDGFGVACDTDVDDDGRVGSTDARQVSDAASRGRYDPRYDFDCDGAISLQDVRRVLEDSGAGRLPGPSALACAPRIEDDAPSGARTDLTGDGIVDAADVASYHTYREDRSFGAALAFTGANNHVVAISDSDQVLVEDLVAFGTGRKVIQVYRSRDVTLRRVWARWEGNGANDGMLTVSAGYRSYGTQLENVLATSNGSQRIFEDQHSNRNIGVDWFRAEDEWAPADPFHTGIRVTGSLSYQLDDGSAGGGIGIGYWFAHAKGFTIENSATWVNDARERSQRPASWVLGVCDPTWFDPARSQGPGCDPTLLPIDNTALNLASWGAAEGRIKCPFNGPCPVIADPSNREDDPRLSVFVADETGVGGQLCDRADEPGVPLWPWPMQDRLLRATATETCYPVPRSLAAARSTWRPDPVDLRADIEAMFGEIPGACIDTDGDRIADARDNCSALANPDQRNDPDRGVVDDFGNRCDCDFDREGSCAAADEALLIDDLCLRAPSLTSIAVNCPLWLARGGVRYSGAATDMNGDGRTDLRDWMLFRAAAAANGGAPGPGPRP